MAQLIDIQRVEVGLENLTARVRIADDAPLMTSEDLQGTTRIYRLLPHIIEHTCLGDAGDTFKACMGNTELAHLLEHVTVELLAQTDIAGDITSGRTFPIEGDPRAFDVEISCKDDVLTVAALSSAAWIIDWAYTGGGDPVPDVEAIVNGLKGLVASLGDEPAQSYEDSVRQTLEQDVRREHQEALEERERQIAERNEEIEQARTAADAAARERAREAEERRSAQEEADRAAREAQEERDRRDAARAAEHEAEERRRADEAAQVAAQEAARLHAKHTAVLMPDDGRTSPEALQASRDIDGALLEWRPRREPTPESTASDAPEQEQEPDEPVPAHDSAPAQEPLPWTDPADDSRPEPLPEPDAASGHEDDIPDSQGVR